MEARKVPHLVSTVGTAWVLCLGLGITSPAGAQSSEEVLARTVGDFDGNGAPDTLAVVMLQGRSFDDPEPWCGGGEKHEGEFEIRVRMAGGATTSRALRSYAFFRSGEWSISLDDYNHDGRPDFNLGQYASCNGWRYELFTVDSSGRVRELQTTRSALPVSDFANSTDDIVTLRDGFEHCYYHSGFGHIVERYRWNEDRGVFLSDGERRVESCPPP